jgi:adenylosuccinate lyase
MTSSTVQNPLYERYASGEIAEIFSSEHRYQIWRQMWIALAESQQELDLPITDAQLASLRQVAPMLDLDRVAEIERETRHDVVAHLRHFAEQAGDAGSILHLGATSAFITDNTDLILAKEALEQVHRKIAGTISELGTFARKTCSIPTLALTHLQPAQLTTVGKRACLWLQDFLTDLESVGQLIGRLRCRGVKGTTGTQASYLTLFDGDHDKVRRLDRKFAEKIGFGGSYPVTGQTYPRKQDSQILAVLSGVGESSHKFGTDLRLLQGLGEMSEPFGSKQVGSSAMAYKRNPIRSERMCALSRRLIIDALNGPMTAATQWFERSLDDSANRRLVIPDAFLLADAILGLAAGIVAGLQVNEERVRFHVGRELPFIATETLLMKATVGGGDRQQLHEIIRTHSMTAHAAVAAGGENPLIDLLVEDPDFHLESTEIESTLDPIQYTGRASDQVTEFLDEVVAPTLENVEIAAVVEPRV